MRALVRAGLATLFLACGCSPASEDERGSVGVPTAADYCQKLGYTLAGDQCRFADGLSCEQWSFYRGQCGQPHSYCNLHGGTVASKTQDMGGWTSVVAICALNGKECDEIKFFQTAKCP